MANNLLPLFTISELPEPLMTTRALALFFQPRLKTELGFQVFQCIIVPSSESSALDELIERLIADWLQFIHFIWAKNFYPLVVIIPQVQTIVRCLKPCLYVHMPVYSYHPFEQLTCCLCLGITCSPQLYRRCAARSETTAAF